LYLSVQTFFYIDFFVYKGWVLRRAVSLLSKRYRVFFFFSFKEILSFAFLPIRMTPPCPSADSQDSRFIPWQRLLWRQPFIISFAALQRVCDVSGSVNERCDFGRMRRENTASDSNLFTVISLLSQITF